MSELPFGRRIARDFGAPAGAYWLMAAMRRWSLQRQHEIQMHDSGIGIPLDNCSSRSYDEADGRAVEPVSGSIPTRMVADPAAAALVQIGSTDTRVPDVAV